MHPHEPHQAVEDDESMAEDVSPRRILVDRIDGRLRDPEAAIPGRKLHLGLDGEAAGGEGHALDRTPREGTESGLQVADVGAGTDRGGHRDRVLANPTHRGNALAIVLRAAHHDVGLAVDDRDDDPRDIRRAMLAIAIDQNKRRRVELQRGRECGVEGGVLALSELVPDHPRAGALGDERGIVGRAIVDDNDRGRDALGLDHQAPDVARLVVAGDGDHNVRRPRRRSRDGG